MWRRTGRRLSSHTLFLPLCSRCPLCFPVFPCFPVSHFFPLHPILIWSTPEMPVGSGHEPSYGERQPGAAAPAERLGCRMLASVPLRSRGGSCADKPGGPRRRGGSGSLRYDGYRPIVKGLREEEGHSRRRAGGGGRGVPVQSRTPSGLSLVRARHDTGNRDRSRPAERGRSPDRPAGSTARHKTPHRTGFALPGYRCNRSESRTSPVAARCRRRGRQQ